MESKGIAVPRWVIAVVVALCIVALIAWRRNEPGVGGRFPDQSSSGLSVSNHFVTSQLAGFEVT